MEKKKGGRRTIIDENFSRSVLTLQAEGLGTRSIAKKLGVSRNTVGKALREASQA